MKATLTLIALVLASSTALAAVTETPPPVVDAPPVVIVPPPVVVVPPPPPKPKQVLPQPTEVKHYHFKFAVPCPATVIGACTGEAVALPSNATIY